MENKFAKNIVLLRNQRKLSQKQVASNLGISQALLSHYEKGVRECGLDFLVKIADFYGVTTDYLLGRTAAVQGSSDENKAQSDKQLPPALRYRRATVHCIEVLYDMLARCQNAQLTEKTGEYLYLAVYRVFRTVYSANSDEPDELFGVPRYMFGAMCDANMRITGTVLQRAATGDAGATYLSLSADVMQDTYDKKFASVKRMISRTEQIIERFGTNGSED